MYLQKSATDLKFNVAQLLREDIGEHREYTFSEHAIVLDDETTLHQVTGRVRFTHTASGVLAAGVVHGTVEAVCTRCLNATQVTLDFGFEDEFHSVVDVTTGYNLPKPTEEDPFFISESHLVDLGEAIRAYALLELPMQPLCRSDCKGICPSCGADLNIEACACHEEEVDERLAALSALLNQNTPDKE